MNPHRSPRGLRAVFVGVILLAGLPTIHAGDNSRVTGLHVSSARAEDFTRVLHDGTHWTLIPRGAILHLPDKFRHRLDRAAGGTPLTWREFLAINRSWIRTESVTPRQLDGRQSLDAARLRRLSGHDKLVIAVFEGGPVRVTGGR